MNNGSYKKHDNFVQEGRKGIINNWQEEILGMLKLQRLILQLKNMLI